MIIIARSMFKRNKAMVVLACSAIVCIADARFIGDAATDGGAVQSENGELWMLRDGIAGVIGGIFFCSKASVWLCTTLICPGACLCSKASAWLCTRLVFPGICICAEAILNGFSWMLRDGIAGIIWGVSFFSKASTWLCTRLICPVACLCSKASASLCTRLVFPGICICAEAIWNGFSLCADGVWVCTNNHACAASVASTLMMLGIIYILSRSSPRSAARLSDARVQRRNDNPRGRSVTEICGWCLRDLGAAPWTHAIKPHSRRANHDDRKHRHDSQASAEREIRRMRVNPHIYEDTARLNAYYNRELGAWFVGRGWA